MLIRCALRSIRWLRSWRQHEDPRVRRAFFELGLAYPPGEWGPAWDVVRGHATEAFETILEEVQLGAESKKEVR